MVLFTIVFLSVGNYTHAATCADWTRKCDTINQCDCSQPGINDPAPYQSDARLCNACKTNNSTLQCNSWETIVNDWVWGKVCCDAQCQAVRTSLIWTPCDNPKWWTMWWANLICSCPQGTKNVNDVCKPCSDPGVCCGVELNTSVPFIGKCIEDVKTNQWSDETSVTWATAFPTLMGSLTKMLVTLILITSFVLIIIGGIMIATWNPSGWKKMIMNVVIGIALLGASGVILRLINPNFFG